MRACPSGGWVGPLSAQRGPGPCLGVAAGAGIGLREHCLGIRLLRRTRRTGCRPGSVIWRGSGLRIAAVFGLGPAVVAGAGAE